MTAKDQQAPLLVRYDSLDALPPAPPLSAAVKAMSGAGVQRRSTKSNPPKTSSSTYGTWTETDRTK
jgi:hypothetical protein